VTALIIASVPLWVIVLRLVTRDAIARGTIAAVVLGFAGVALLVLPEASAGGADGLGYMLLVAASVSWASGSFLSSKVALPRDPFTSTALQMLTGGAVIAIAATIRGEFSGIDVAEFSGASIAALLYLIVAGSLLAFTAYTWLLRNGPISKVSTYAYVNPVVAVILGWLILDEPVTASILAGAALVVLSVAFIVRIESRPRRRAAPEPGTAAAPVAAEN
jgi:drug/metabolite transporter (DMT)-like permease